MRVLGLTLLLLLVGCQGTPHHPTRSVQASSQDSRVQYVVLHYTSSNLAESLATLSRGQVSSHYLISESGHVWQLVDEHARAWHAGDSQWQGRTYLNAHSIGIELVNEGYVDEADGTRRWFAYPDAQIRALEVLLADILQRHQLGPERVLGHSDIAPGRKVDPGPLFPWARLATAGLAQALDDSAVARASQQLGQSLPDSQWFSLRLQRLGYLAPWYRLTDDSQEQHLRKALRAFQLRYRASDFEGEKDLASAALLQALTSD